MEHGPDTRKLKQELQQQLPRGVSEWGEIRNHRLELPRQYLLPAQNLGTYQQEELRRQREEEKEVINIYRSIIISQKHWQCVERARYRLITKAQQISKDCGGCDNSKLLTLESMTGRHFFFHVKY